jgi:hypothetical protein
MQFLKVGSLYHGQRRAWPEGADYNFRGGHELRIFLARAGPAEVEAIRSDPIEFGMFVEPLGLMLLTRFGRACSFDCSYSWHRMAEVTGDRTLPPATEETSPALRALLAIVLVEATTGVVLALRTVTFSPEFTRVLHRAIAAQAGAPYDSDAHFLWGADMMRLTTDKLWAQCTVHCHGGD